MHSVTYRSISNIKNTCFVNKYTSGFGIWFYFKIYIYSFNENCDKHFNMFFQIFIKILSFLLTGIVLKMQITPNPYYIVLKCAVVNLYGLIKYCSKFCNVK